jgi:pimeloyl-ACP methyl ester carboxylesterase
VSREDIEVANGDVVLGGSVWTPDDRPPRSLILMYPGSGPSDRHNDVFFPGIRAAFLEAGAAVTSFDKRGVGSSTGDWLEADIHDQAGDLAAFLERARMLVPDVPVGLFGHSQGGWVVVEAAAAVSPDFVITSSGPSVTPRAQEEYSTQASVDRLGLDGEQAATLMTSYRELFDRLSAGESWALVSEWMRPRADEFGALAEAGAFIPDGPELWGYAGLIIDHDPAPALAALTVPLLAVLGGTDEVVPVAACVDGYRRTVRPDLLTLRVIDGGDHRIQDPETGELIPEYLPTLTSFVGTHHH